MAERGPVFCSASGEPSLHTPEPTSHIPELGEAEWTSQNLDAGVEKPIFVQKYCTSSSSDLLPLRATVDPSGVGFESRT
jgi:hypothetical protein